MQTVIKHNNSVVITEHHVKIVTMLSKGKTYSDIANSTKTNTRTIEGQILILRRKYKCGNVTHLVAHFLRLGIIK